MIHRRTPQRGRENRRGPNGCAGGGDASLFVRVRSESEGGGGRKRAPVYDDPHKQDLRPHIEGCVSVHGRDSGSHRRTLTSSLKSPSSPSSASLPRCVTATFDCSMRLSPNDRGSSALRPLVLTLRRPDQLGLHDPAAHTDVATHEGEPRRLGGRDRVPVETTPPATAAQTGAAQRCRVRPGSHSRWTCSSRKSLPSGTRTRHNSESTARGSPTVHRANALTAVANVLSSYGSASARPSETTMRAAASPARRRARAAMSGSGSSAVTSTPGAYHRNCAPVPAPISSTRPWALRTSRRRHAATAARSNGHITASYTTG